MIFLFCFPLYVFSRDFHFGRPDGNSYTPKVRRVRQWILVGTCLERWRPSAQSTSTGNGSRGASRSIAKRAASLSLSDSRFRQESQRGKVCLTLTSPNSRFSFVCGTCRFRIGLHGNFNFGTFLQAHFITIFIRE